MKVYFISVNTLKENTTINFAVEDKLLENSIIDAQHIDIEAILGTQLYLKIKSGVTNDNLSGDYKTLMDDYLHPTLIKAAEKRALIYIFAKIREKGVVQNDDVGNTAVDITILNKIRKEILSDFAYYSNRMKDYIGNNTSSFPEYSENSGSDVNPDNSDSYFTGFYLGD